MRTTRHVALAFPVTVGVSEELVRGIMEYARQHGPWTFLCGSEALTMSVLSLARWPGDGIIAAVLTKREAEAAARLGRPVVNISGALLESRLPRVKNDDCATGRLAAEHLLDCGFRRFAYYGIQGAWYSQQRCRGFAACVKRRGYPCAVLTTAGIADGKGTWHGWQESLRRWLDPLQRPLAVMACNDALARMVADTCRTMGLHVPHDVAVIGDGNNPLICETSSPMLTSVAKNGREIGYRAAQMLDRLMAGRRPPKRDVMVAPMGVIARQSTDVVAIDDPEMSRAMRYIHDRLDQPFRISDLVRDVSVSRRWLEYRFRQELGRSPYEYICQSRVARAQQLLLGPRLRATELAAACGFSSASHLQRVFQRVTGATPAEYRRQNVPHDRQARRV